MGLAGADSKLKYVHLILLLLVTGVIILGLVYLNETSQKVQLQQKVLFMEKQAHHIVAERSIIRTRANHLQGLVENQKNDIKNIQEICNSHLEEQQQECSITKNDLLKTISTNDKVIMNLKRDYELLQKRFDSLNLQMEEFEKAQSRLLEKFSTQSTQCMKVINLVSELCNEKNDNKLRKVSVSNITDGIFLKRTTVAEELNRTQEIFLISNASSTNSSEKLVRLEAPQGRTLNNNLTNDSGDNNTTASIETFENTTQMLSADQKQDEESNIIVELENRLIEDIVEADAIESNNIDKLNDNFEDDEDIMTLLLQEKKSQNMKKLEDLQTEKRNEFINNRDVASDHRNNTNVQAKHTTQTQEQIIPFSNIKKKLSPKRKETDNMNDMESKQEKAAQESSASKVVVLKNETAQVKVNAEAKNNISELLESMEVEHSAKLNRLKQSDNQINITVPNLVPNPTTNVSLAKESYLDTDKRAKSEKEGYSTRRNDGNIIINTVTNKEKNKKPTAKLNIPQALHKENILTVGERKNNNYKKNELNQL
ncbi:hybrid signal transduction histidine kinase H isoform X1 [Xenopus laevis]|uniref:Hybrid Signal transduction Histidine kinase H isoform X1 n=1 Tax=Xenopus laevis TaxID=8355 RepID=A0A8J0URZ8_XENLA|nr:hybrid signal transduction histidine kinase H isoform X1 [Xenopus laevis]XP_041442657.1 hybrid signal transduction histidine kinase H isoform X1 [Xenopus laevis]